MKERETVLLLILLLLLSCGTDGEELEEEDEEGTIAKLALALPTVEASELTASGVVDVDDCCCCCVVDWSGEVVPSGDDEGTLHASKLELDVVMMLLLLIDEAARLLKEFDDERVGVVEAFAEWFKLVVVVVLTGKKGYSKTKKSGIKKKHFHTQKTHSMRVRDYHHATCVKVVIK